MKTKKKIILFLGVMKALFLIDWLPVLAQPKTIARSRQPAADTTAHVSSRTLRALVIGVNKFADAKIKNLSFCTQ